MGIPRHCRKGDTSVQIVDVSILYDLSDTGLVTISLLL
jgi:hypothetical protein